MAYTNRCLWILHECTLTFYPIHMNVRGYPIDIPGLLQYPWMSMEYSMDTPGISVEYLRISVELHEYPWMSQWISLNAPCRSMNAHFSYALKLIYTTKILSNFLCYFSVVKPRWWYAVIPHNTHPIYVVETSEQPRHNKQIYDWMMWSLLVPTELGRLWQVNNNHVDRDLALNGFKNILIGCCRSPWSPLSNLSRLVWSWVPISLLCIAF